MDWQLLSILFFAVGFLLPGCSCCGVECGTGGGYCSSTPANVTITATGFTNNGCANCANYNATYIIPRDTAFPHPNNCNWQLSAAKGCAAPGNGDFISAAFLASGTDTEFRAQIAINTPVATTHVFWSTIMGASPIACGGFGTFMVPINTIFSQNDCFHDGSDLTVTI